MSVEDFDLSGYTLFERQSKFYNGSHCVYCLSPTDLVDSIKVYRESHGLIYYCGDCQAWCGTHKNANNNNDQSLGCVAKKTLREYRHETHKWFEPLIAVKINHFKISKRKAKALAYNWVASLLNIDQVESHIGYFNLSQCKKVIDACKAAYPTDEVVAARLDKIKFNKDVWYFNQTDYELEIKEFTIMNNCHLEIFHAKSGKRLKYWPKENESVWENGKRKKIIDTGDIDKFLETHFK